MRLITPPEPPFTLAEAKNHLRVDHDDEDDLIALYMDAAVSAIDGPHGRLKKAVLAQTWEAAFDAFPSGELRLPVMPLLSVESVQYVDEDGIMQTAGADLYETDAYSDYGWIVPVGSWPAAMATINAVVVRWVAGQAVCPPDLKAAMLLMLGHLYENRTAVSRDAVHELPLAIASICDRHRRYVIA